MDLNYLYHRHQVSLFMAENASSRKARQAHRELADRCEAQIAEAKRPHLTTAAA
jgi:hypothetical protein